MFEKGLASHGWLRLFRLVSLNYLLEDDDIKRQTAISSYHTQSPATLSFLPWHTRKMLLQLFTLLILKCMSWNMMGTWAISGKILYGTCFARCLGYFFNILLNVIIIWCKEDIIRQRQTDNIFQLFFINIVSYTNSGYANFAEPQRPRGHIQSPWRTSSVAISEQYDSLKNKEISIVWSCTI